MKPTITDNEKIAAFALYVMAIQQYTEVRKYEKAIAKIFGDRDEYNGHLSDAIYSGDLDASMNAFDEILDRNKIKVVKGKK